VPDLVVLLDEPVDSGGGLRAVGAELSLSEKRLWPDLKPRGLSVFSDQVKSNASTLREVAK